MSNPMRHDQHITQPMTCPMTDPQMKTKTMDMTIDKTRADMIFVKTFTRPEFFGLNFTQKRINWINGKFATKQCENFEMPKIIL